MNVLDVWEDDVNTEARRVLYVAASRARSVLAFGVTASNAPRVARPLRRDDVPIDVR
jgi:DNA helicase-2/ATP-dependent DNA helicase PcrA